MPIHCSTEVCSSTCDRFVATSSNPSEGVSSVHLTPAIRMMAHGAYPRRLVFQSCGISGARFRRVRTGTTQRLFQELELMYRLSAGNPRSRNRACSCIWPQCVFPRIRSCTSAPMLHMHVMMLSSGACRLTLDVKLRPLVSVRTLGGWHGRRAKEGLAAEEKSAARHPRLARAGSSSRLVASPSLALSTP